MLHCHVRTLALEESIGLYVSRVASKENIADDPSRERDGLGERMRVKWVSPRLLQRFPAPGAWDSVRVR